MSFIDTYIKKHRIGDISLSTRKNLKNIERELSKITLESKKGLSFLDSIKEHGGEIGDLIERVQQRFDGHKFSFSDFKFIYSIAIEVYQIIDSMNDEIVPDGFVDEQEWQAKRNFGKQLIYFVWKTIGPLRKVRWIPFKKTIEKKLVLWIAGMGLDAAHDMFKANKEEVSFLANNKVVLVKALK